ncbi:MAG: alpha/beta hydrolase [Myxococcota bacterium]|nr:alpha/beta hydrolase [Myxococcota bacterium]
MVSFQRLGQPRSSRLLIANGLGARLYSWLPLLPTLLERFEILCWNYRGLFDLQEEGSALRWSEQSLAIETHGSDLIELAEDGFDTHQPTEHLHLLGWSMGVQVCLSAALQAPGRFQSLLLLNGCSGQVFESVFRPFSWVPKLPFQISPLVDQLRKRRRLIGSGCRVLSKISRHVALSQRLLDPLLLLTLSQYLGDLEGERLELYLRLFQDLDAHSVDTELDQIQVPVTVISGELDPLTPCHRGEALAQQLPRGVHHTLIGTHFLVFERSETLIKLISAHFNPTN